MSSITECPHTDQPYYMNGRCETCALAMYGDTNPGIGPERAPGQERKATRCPHPERKHFAHNLCRQCYNRKRYEDQHGQYQESPHGVAPLDAPRAPATVTNCEHNDQPHYALGLCGPCYRSKRYQERKKQA